MNILDGIRLSNLNYQMFILRRTNLLTWSVALFSPGNKRCCIILGLDLYCWFTLIHLQNYWLQIFLNWILNTWLFLIYLLDNVLIPWFHLTPKRHGKEEIVEQEMVCGDRESQWWSERKMPEVNLFSLLEQCDPLLRLAAFDWNSCSSLPEQCRSA